VRSPGLHRRELATTKVQDAAKAEGWLVSKDRLHELNEASRENAPLTVDLCPEHAAPSTRIVRETLEDGRR
jgi:hypothetical protein